MIVDKKRVAYHRVPANELLVSTVAETRGKHAGKVQEIFMRVSVKESPLYQWISVDPSMLLMCFSLVLILFIEFAHKIKFECFLDFFSWIKSLEFIF